MKRKLTAIEPSRQAATSLIASSERRAILQQGIDVSDARVDVGNLSELELPYVEDQPEDEQAQEGELDNEQLGVKQKNYRNGRIHLTIT